MFYFVIEIIFKRNNVKECEILRFQAFKKKNFILKKKKNFIYIHNPLCSMHIFSLKFLGLIKVKR